MALPLADAVAAEPRESTGRPFLADLSAQVLEREVWAIAQDGTGLMYLATGFGVVEYDGQSTRILALENGSIARSLATHASGVIYVGGIGEIGVLSRDETGVPIYRSLEDPSGEHLEGLRDVWRLWPTERGFLAWTLDRVLEWDGQSFSSWPLEVRTMPARIGSQLVLFDRQGHLLRLTENGLQPAGRLLGMGEEWVRILLPRADGGAWLGTGQSSLWQLGPEHVKDVLEGRRPELRPIAVDTEADSMLEQGRLYDGVALGDGRIALATMSGGAVVLDAEGRLLHRLDRSVGLPDNSVWALGKDRDGGLWLGLSRGLARASLEIPISEYGEMLGLEGKVQAVARSQGVLWAATSMGLFRLGEDGFSRVEQVPGTCWSLLSTDPTPSAGPKLLVGAFDGVYEVDGDRIRRVFEVGHAFSLHPSTQHPGVVWVGFEAGVAALEPGPEHWSASVRELGAQVRSILEAPDGALWLGALIDNVRRLAPVSPGSLDAAPIRSFGPAEGLEVPNGVRLFTHGERVLAATADGLSAWDPDAERFETSELFGPDPGGLSRVVAGHGNSYWLTRDGRFPRWVDVDGVDQEGVGPGGSSPDGALVSAEQIFRYLPTPDAYTYFPESPERCWIGTSKGLFLFHGRPDDGAVAAPAHRRLLWRSIEADSQLRPLGGPLELDSPRSRISFSWSLPVFGEPLEQRYRFRLRGLDEHWTEWGPETRADYMNLPGGRYTFEVEARDLNGVVFSSLSTVLRAPWPWYWTYPARFGWALVAALLIWAVASIRSLKLRRERDRLEREVSSRTHELRLARDEARSAAEAKGQFLANMSHEIRTPMNGVIGVTELLLRTQLGEQQRRYVEIVKMCGTSLLTLIDEILDVSKIEAGELHLERRDFELAPLMEAVTAMLGVLANEKNLELTVHIDDNLPAWFHGDASRLRQILLNLVGNALKFTERGQVHVEAKLDAAHRDVTDPEVTDQEVTGQDAVDQGGAGQAITVHFAVVDTGIGIPADKADRLFRPFSQVDASQTRKYGGSGLGLVIAKELVEMMGGRIGVDSEQGVGSTFWFTLPLGPAQADHVEDPPAQPESGLPQAAAAPLRVLLVEDNPLNQLVASELLADLGHEVTVANGGEQALELYPRHDFDVVLMDIQMPGMDGLEATSRMRDLDKEGGAVPIIALTAHALKEDRERFLDAGMDGYLAKPLRPEQLEETLNRLPTPRRRG